MPTPQTGIQIIGQTHQKLNYVVLLVKAKTSKTTPPKGIIRNCIYVTLVETFLTKMNYEQIKTGLSAYDKKEVNRYINYLKFLEADKDKDGKLKNGWFKYTKEDQLIDIYQKVAIDNLSIDGETVTITYKGKLMADYNYQAYKNKVLSVYPETKFDIQLVHQGDDFSFHKDSGRVIYSHNINDPFNSKREIIGTYCVIKNKRGEFLETLNMADITKMKATAKTKNVWNEWESEMVLKSVIKRACKRHFRDITQNIDSIDNDNYDPELVTIDDKIQEMVANVKTIAELNKLYKDKKNSVKDNVKFVDLCSERKREILESLPMIHESEYNTAIDMLIGGKKIDDLLLIWKIDEETQQDLMAAAL